MTFDDEPSGEQKPLIVEARADIERWARDAEARAKANALRDHIWDMAEDVVASMRIHNRPERTEADATLAMYGIDAQVVRDVERAERWLEINNIFEEAAAAAEVEAALDAVHASRRRLPIEWPEVRS